MSTREIVIDAEFRDLLPPLSPEQRAGLEADLIERGCQDSLKVWAETGILLDGHHRLTICEARGLAYRVEEMSFPDREAAKLWMIGFQRDRRNIADIDLVIAVLPFRGRLDEQAKANIKAAQETSPKRGGKACTNGYKPIDVLAELARLAGLPRMSFWRLMKIVEDGNPVLIQSVRDKTLSVSAAYQMTHLFRGDAEVKETVEDEDEPEDEPEDEEEEEEPEPEPESKEQALRRIFRELSGHLPKPIVDAMLAQLNPKSEPEPEPEANGEPEKPLPGFAPEDVKLSHWLRFLGTTKATLESCLSGDFYDIVLPVWTAHQREVAAGEMEQIIEMCREHITILRGVPSGE